MRCWPREDCAPDDPVRGGPQHAVRHPEHGADLRVSCRASGCEAFDTIFGSVVKPNSAGFVKFEKKRKRVRSELNRCCYSQSGCLGRLLLILNLHIASLPLVIATYERLQGPFV